MQPLKYAFSNTRAMNEKIFGTLAWAAYLSDWPGPKEGERPSAYIIILRDKDIPMPSGVDHGIAAQTIMLGAVAHGLGGCMIGNIRRPQLQEILGLPDKYEILLVLALGKPKEEVVIDEINPGDSVKYWRDENKVHHVPKRKLKDIVLKL